MYFKIILNCYAYNNIELNGILPKYSNDKYYVSAEYS